MKTADVEEGGPGGGGGGVGQEPQVAVRCPVGYRGGRRRGGMGRREWRRGPVLRGGMEGLEGFRMGERGAHDGAFVGGGGEVRVLPRGRRQGVGAMAGIGDLDLNLDQTPVLCGHSSGGSSGRWLRMVEGKGEEIGGEADAILPDLGLRLLLMHLI